MTKKEKAPEPINQAERLCGPASYTEEYERLVTEKEFDYGPLFDSLFLWPLGDLLFESVPFVLALTLLFLVLLNS